MDRSSKRLRPGALAVLGIVITYILAAAVAAALTGNREFLFYIGIMVVLLGLAGFVHARVNLSTGLLGCLAAWGAMHMAGGLIAVPQSWPIDGDIRVLYSWWLVPGYLKYDQLVHAFGFGSTCWLCWQAIQAAAGGSLKPSLGVLSLCVFAACGLGAANEIVEFIATKLGPTNVGGYENTAWDLVANAVGAIAAAVAIRLKTPLRRPTHVTF